jgi:hypothetical protein
MPTSRERAGGNEHSRVGVAVLDRDDLGFAELWSRGVHARVDKFDLDAIHAAAKFHGLLYREPNGDELLTWAKKAGYTPDYAESDGNLLTTAGLARITSLITAGGGQAWDTTHTRIGVGNDATAAGVGNTDLTAAAGSSNRQFQTADNSTPTTSNGVITVRATHGTSVSNFHWQEWGIDQGTANGTTVVATLMNHKVTDLGTKTSAASWVFTVTVTLA